MRQRWLTLALAISVALNLFFLGVAAARWWRHEQWRAEHGGEAARATNHGQGAGGERSERRRGSRRGRGGPLAWMTEAERAELRPKRQALVGIRRDAEQLLGAEPFDAVRFQTALQALRAETAQIQTAVHEKLLHRAATLSPEERRKLAETSWGTPGDRGRETRRRD